MAHDELGAHMRDELGITEIAAASPFQAAWTSVIAFTAGAILPLLAITLAPTSVRIAVCAVVALLALVGLGALGARAGGAPWKRGAAARRVVVVGRDAPHVRDRAPRRRQHQLDRASVDQSVEAAQLGAVALPVPHVLRAG